MDYHAIDPVCYVYCSNFMKMFEIFKEYISSNITLSEEEWAKIKLVSIDKKLRKREFLLREGEIWKYCAFVGTGCLRTYRLDEEGYEHILEFSKERWWTGDVSSISTGKPSKYYIDAVEDTAVVLINTDDFDQLCMEIPKLGILMNNNLKQCLGSNQGRVDIAISYNMEEKYRNFLTEYPDLSMRIPQYMIASYIGITPESLSRLRKQLVRA